MELKEKFKWQDINDYHIPSLAICGNCKHKQEQFCFHPEITSENESSMDFLEVSSQAVCNKHEFKYEV